MRTHFHVSPRYTCGSPATVPGALASQVADEERRAYERCLSGVYGTEAADKARTLGLAGIAEERSGYRRKGYTVRDLITGESSFREFK